MKIYTDNQFGKKLGIAVKKLRERNNMSQEDLREKASLSTGYVSRLEAGGFTSPSIAQIYAIAKAFEMNLRDLLECAGLIEIETSFENCLRGQGLSEEQIQKLKSYKEFIVQGNTSD